MNDHLFDETMENLPHMGRTPPIEPKGVFVKVGLEVGFVHSALMCRTKPALQQRRNKVHVGKEFHCPLWVSRHRGDSMRESGGLDSIIPIPVVRVHNSARLHNRADKPDQAVAGGICHFAQPDAADLLSVQLDGYSRLFSRTGG